MTNTMNVILVTVFLFHSAANASTEKVQVRQTNLRHRDLGEGGEMCLDLGPRRGGMHDMEVTADIKKFLKYESVGKGKCPQDQGTTRMNKRRKRSLDNMEKFCKHFNKEKVTIVGPEIIKKWMKDEVEASYGPCEDEDKIIIIEEN